MLRSLMSVLRHPLRAAFAVTLLLVVASVPATPVSAAAPFPPLSGCLGSGSFFLQDDACSSVRPIRGDQFGPITSVQRVTLQPGDSVILSYPGGESIDFDAPQGPCGENGCPRASVHWRAAGTGAGIAFESGCGPNDPSCQVSVSPSIGDAGEDVTVLLAQRYNGINPIDGVAYAIYAPPQLYPIRVDTITPSGTAFRLDSGDTAYAVRNGTSALQASCVADDWWIAAGRQDRVAAPVCITLTPGDDANASFQGILPNDGQWTITGSPAGELQEPIGSRPTPFDRVTVTPANDDIRISMDHHQRPGIEVDMTPASPTMELGASQDVTLTLRAADGDGGSIPSITFSSPDGIEAIAAPDSALSVGSPPGGIPADLALRPNESRTIIVPVTAVGLGTTTLRVTVNAIDDVGGTSIDGVSIPISVTVGDAATGDGPSPVITHARNLPSTLQDTIEGTIAGTPDSHVTVSLAAARRVPDGSCARIMSGGDVEPLGSVAVDIGPDGTGSFSLTGHLGSGQSVYGLAVADGVISPVGECTPVTSSDPSIRVSETQAFEPQGTRKRPTRAPAGVVVELSDPSESPVTVTVATTDGSAHAPDDYTALSPTVITFAPGETRHELPIEVVGDGRKDDEETFLVALAEATGGTVAPDASTSTVSILDPSEDDGVGRDGILGTYSSKATSGGKTTRQKALYRIRSYDPETGRIDVTIRGTKVHFSGTVRDGQMHASLSGKNVVPGTWDCTVSTPDGVTTFTCELEQGKYANLKAQRYHQVWTHD